MAIRKRALVSFLALLLAVAGCDTGGPSAAAPAETPAPMVTVFSGDTPTRIEITGAPKGYLGPYKVQVIDVPGGEVTLETIYDPSTGNGWRGALPRDFFPPEALELMDDPELSVVLAELAREGLKPREIIERVEELARNGDDPRLNILRETPR